MGHPLLRSAAVAYAGGSLGGMINSLLIFFAFMLGIDATFGVTAMADWTLGWVYPRLVWGGVLAFLMILPFYQSRWVVRGLVWSIVPTIPALFTIFPGQADTIAGGSIEVGVITLICVYLFNCVWGLIASYTLHKMA